MSSLENRPARFLRTTASPGQVALFAFIPAVVLGVVLFAELRWGRSLGDFSILRTASHAVLHGRSPYVPADAQSLAGNDKFVYPPVTAILFSPFALLPLEAARVLMLVTAIAAVAAALWLLDVRDWRCYGIALATAPVVDSVSLGALSPFLLLGAAAAWRFRDRAGPAGGAVALAGVTKVFLWPLGVWLLATRRLRAALWAAALSAVLVLAGWSVIAFAGLTAYPHLLRVLSDLEATQSYSLVGLFRLTGTAASLVSLLLVAAVVAGVVLAARGEDGDRRSFSIAVGGALLATPVVWLHYFVLLLIPLALYRPRLSALWFLPLAFWITPLAHSDGSVWRTAFALCVATATVALAVTSRAERAETTLAPGGPVSARL